MNLIRAILQISPCVLSTLLLVACATSTPIKDTMYSGDAFIKDKQQTLTEVGQFDFDRRITIHKIIDDLSKRLYKYPKRRVLKTSRSNAIKNRTVFKLVDIDGDGDPDKFSYTAEDRADESTPDYGFIYDLNRDGKVDYIVFNQGVVMAKDETNPFKFVHTLYHWIDSNNDGIIDIWVYPDIDLDGDKMVDDQVFGWLYDSNGDGSVDSGEYIAANIKQAIDIKDDVINIKRLGQEEDASLIQKSLTHIQELSNKMLIDINTLI